MLPKKILKNLKSFNRNIFKCAQKPKYKDIQTGEVSLYEPLK